MGAPTPEELEELASICEAALKSPNLLIKFPGRKRGETVSQWAWRAFLAGKAARKAQKWELPDVAASHMLEWLSRAAPTVASYGGTPEPRPAWGEGWTKEGAEAWEQAKKWQNLVAIGSDDFPSSALRAL